MRKQSAYIHVVLSDKPGAPLDKRHGAGSVEEMAAMVIAWKGAKAAETAQATFVFAVHACLMEHVLG